MLVRSVVTAFTLFVVGSSHAGAISSLEQKAVIVRLCTKVIDEYAAYLAGAKRPKNVIALQREYTRCAEVIGEYDDSLR